MSGCSSAEVIGLSIGVGVLGLSTLVLCVLRHIKGPSTSPCVYCNEVFETAVLREHLQTCPGHLEVWSRKSNQAARVWGELVPPTYYFKPTILPKPSTPPKPNDTFV